MLKGSGSKNSNNLGRHNDFKSASRFASVKDGFFKILDSNRLCSTRRQKKAVLDRQNALGDEEHRLNYDRAHDHDTNNDRMYADRSKLVNSHSNPWGFVSTAVSERCAFLEILAPDQAGVRAAKSPADFVVVVTKV